MNRRKGDGRVGGRERVEGRGIHLRGKWWKTGRTVSLNINEMFLMAFYMKSRKWNRDGEIDQAEKAELRRFLF